MKVISYCERLQGYTLPLVISALEKLDPPTAIAVVPNEKQRGPLLVTLAAELASIIVGLIYESLTSAIGRDEFTDLLRILGGKDYQTAQQNYERAFNEKTDLICAITALEQHIIRFGVGEIVGKQINKRTGTKSINGGNIRWLEKPQYGSKPADFWKAEHRKLSSRLALTLRKVNSAQVRLSRLRLNLLQSQTFPAARERYLKTRGLHTSSSASEIRIDFDSSNPLLMDGPAYILHRTDPKWWQAFKAHVSNSLKKSTKRGHQQIMLRDALFCQTARLLSYVLGTSGDEQLIELMRNPNSMPAPLDRISKTSDATSFDTKTTKRNSEVRELVYPGAMRWAPYLGRAKIGLNDEDMRFWRRFMRTQDTAAQAWIKRNAGSYHPYDFYAFANTKIPEVSHVVKLHSQYPPERARNELYWCLCDGTKESFVPQFSISFPTEKWNEWVCSAARSNPRYYAKVK